MVLRPKLCGELSKKYPHVVDIMNFLLHPISHYCGFWCKHVTLLRSLSVVGPLYAGITRARHLQINCQDSRMYMYCTSIVVQYSYWHVIYSHGHTLCDCCYDINFFASLHIHSVYILVE